MTNTTNGATVQVNGKKFTVENVAEATITLRGSRGGWASLVKNAKSGNWSLVTERAIAPVASIAVVA